MTSKRKGPGCMGWTIIAVIVLALAGFGVWRWAVAQGSADTLDWIDAKFPRERAIKLTASGHYGNDPAQRVEIWTPTGQEFAEMAPPEGTPVQPLTYPLVVFIHGGGWHSGAPESYRFVARTLGEHGFATALVGYRMVPGGRYPAMLEDSAAAVRWIRDQSSTAQVNRDGIVLSGHSAGAYNVLMLGLDPQWLAGAGVPQSAIAGVVSLAGPADFFPFDKDSSKNAFGHVADGTVTQPIAFARGDAPPMLLLHGTADTVVRPYNSQNLSKAIKQAGGKADLIEYDDMSHAGVVMGLSKPFAQGGKVLDPIVRFARELQQTAADREPPASAPVQGAGR